MTRIILPAQNINIDTKATGVDPTWYEKLSQLTAFANLFSEVNPKTLTNGQVLIWNAAQQKFLPGAN
jgi:hypothetical protein